ncbi:MAG: hypothetical protein Q3993_01215 [Filifactor alocis]|nr:hypothetical protein [Filifactor alocis]
MKRWKKIAAFALAGAIGALPGKTHANSAQIYFEGGTGVEHIVLKEDSPIRINSEELTFDFEKGGEIEVYGYHYPNLFASVYVKYEMQNTADSPQKVDMVFPFVEDMERAIPFLAEDRIHIKDAETPIPFTFLTANYYDGYESREYSIEQMIRQLKARKENTLAEFIKENGVRIYRFVPAEMTPQEKVQIVVTGILAPETKVLAIGPTRGESFQGTKMAVSFLPDGDDIFLISFGKEINFLESKFRSWGSGEDRDLGEAGSFVPHEEDAEEFLETYFRKEWKEELSKRWQLENDLGDTFWREFCTDLMQYLEGEKILVAEDLVRRFTGSKKAILLQYGISFAPNETKTVIIEYPTTSHTDTREDTHEIEYLLHPAKYWKSFENLTVRLIPPKSHPYIVEGSMKFKKEDGAYTAFSEQLPQEDLRILLGANPQLLWRKRMKKLLVPLLIVLLYFVRRRRKRGRVKIKKI